MTSPRIDAPNAVAEDHRQLTNLVARYAELLNLGRLDDVGALFRYGKITAKDNPNTYEGTEQVIEMYRDSVTFGPEPPDTLIFTTNLQLDIDGDDATGKAYFLAMHVAAGAVKPVLGGRYHDRFRRIDGTWWFAHRHMIADLQGDLSTHLNRPLDEYLVGEGEPDPTAET